MFNSRKTVHTKLRFYYGNAKLNNIWTFSLPAGFFCPFADQCRSKADRRTGVITDGPATSFRCYAASNEASNPSVRDSRWHNAQLLRGKSRYAMAKLILDSLSPYAGYVRVHVSGDFFSQSYFDSWIDLAQCRPRTLFYAYTKS